MKRTIGAVLFAVVLTTGCGSKSDKAERRDQQYDVVEEGSAAGVSSTIAAPGESPATLTAPAITGTNADTTTDFQLPVGTHSTSFGQQGTIAGTLPNAGATAPAPGTWPQPRVVQPRQTPSPMMSSTPAPAPSSVQPGKPRPAPAPVPSGWYPSTPQERPPARPANPPTSTDTRSTTSPTSTNPPADPEPPRTTTTQPQPESEPEPEEEPQEPPPPPPPALRASA